MRMVLLVPLWAMLLLAGPARAQSLFEALGGSPGLVAIVDAADATWRADPRIAAVFEDTAPARFKRLLVEQLCQLSGGGCQYTGRDMHASHKALGLDRRQFNAVVEGLQSAMDHCAVPFGTQNRLLALLAPMQRDVVTR